VRSCTDATDSSGTLTNDSYATPLRLRHSSEHGQSHLPIAGQLQFSATGESTETAKKCTSASRCSLCSQDPVRDTSGEDSQLKSAPQLSDEECRFLELQRSRGAIPKCRSDHHPRSHSGNFSAFTCFFVNFYCQEDCHKLEKVFCLTNIVTLSQEELWISVLVGDAV